jgi:uncharacterized protein YigA (DUF484 family)
MAQSAVSLWKRCLKALQQLTADPSNNAAVESALCDLLPLLKGAHALQDLPHATVKKLVNELQVGVAWMRLLVLGHLDRQLMFWASGAAGGKCLCCLYEQHCLYTALFI